MVRARAPATNTNSPTDLASETAFELLANRRRQHVLQYLAEQVGAVEVDELVAHVSRAEIGPDAPDDRVRASLYHTHLPKLADVGVVTYDQEREVVEGTVALTQLSPFFELADVDASE